jgi:ribosomal protein S18 acetylase RimI-like enzyme
MYRKELLMEQPRRVLCMAEFIVRPATRDDFPAIRSLIHTVRINPFGLDWRRFLVAVTPQDKLLGCGQIKLHGDGLREMASIAVQEQARGHGVAQAVIKALIVLEPQRPIYGMCRDRLKLLYMKFGSHSIGIDEMPPYFRRIFLIERFLHSNAKPNDRLLVMRVD